MSQSVYSFPTHGNDELEQRFDLPCPIYSNESLEQAQAWWDRQHQDGLHPTLYVQLLSVCEGSVAEATVLFDTLAFHFDKGHADGLAQFVSRSAAYFVEKYGRTMLSERTCSRAIAELRTDGLLVFWPQAGNVAAKFRLNWVALVERLVENAKAGHALPGVHINA